MAGRTCWEVRLRACTRAAAIRTVGRAASAWTSTVDGATRMNTWAAFTLTSTDTHTGRDARFRTGSGATDTGTRRKARFRGVAAGERLRALEPGA